MKYFCKRILAKQKMDKRKVLLSIAIELEKATGSAKYLFFLENA